MTQIIIDGIADYQDLLMALARVADVFTDDRAFAVPNHTFYKQQEDAEPDLPVLDAHEVRRSPYIACPRRGTHLRLTECAACWADVMQGHAIEPDLLSPDAWDLGLRAIED